MSGTRTAKSDENGQEIQGGLEAARGFVDAGWSVVPVPYGSKECQITGWTTRPHDSLEGFNGHPQNIAVRMGEPSGRAADGLPGYMIDIDLDSPEARILSHLLPHTDCAWGRESSPCSHLIYIVDSAVGTKKYIDPTPKEGMRATIAEILSDGHLANAPCSLHPSGELVTWYMHGVPIRLPADVLVKAVGRFVAAALLTRHWPNGARHEASLALAGGLKHAGWTELEAKQFIMAIAVAANDLEAQDRIKAVETTYKKSDGSHTTGFTTLSKLIGREVVACVCEWADIKSPDQRAMAELNNADPAAFEKFMEAGSDLSAPLMTDVGMGKWFAKLNPLLKYVNESKRWYCYGHGVWRVDDKGVVFRAAKLMGRHVLAAAEKETDERRKDRLLKWAMICFSAGKVRDIGKMAESEASAAARVSDFDKDPFAFNCLNGTLDPRTGVLRPHDPNDFITKQANVAWEGLDASCPLWLAFIDRILAGNAELIRFVQQWLGYCLTGDIREQYLPIFYGGGNNGKNVLLDTVSDLMGDYASEAPPGLLEASKYERHPTEIMDLMGRRLVVASEMKEGAVFNLQFAKRATGNPRLKGRWMRGDFVDYVRAHKFVLMTNNMPRIIEDTEAVWRRLLLVLFGVTIPEGERDPDLKDKLKAEWPGILVWLVRGCMDWSENGLVKPSIVRQATAEYRQQENPVAEFIEECCELGDYVAGVSESLRFAVTVNDIWESYDVWCERSGRHALSNRTFAAVLRAAAPRVEKQTAKFSGKDMKAWVGIKLKGDAPRRYSPPPAEY